MNFQRQEGTYDPQQLIARHLLTNFLAKPDFIAYDIRDKEALSKKYLPKMVSLSVSGVDGPIGG